MEDEQLFLLLEKMSKPLLVELLKSILKEHTQLRTQIKVGLSQELNIKEISKLYGNETIIN